MKVVLESNIIGQKWAPIRILDRPIMIGDLVILKSVAETLDDNGYYEYNGLKSRCHIYRMDNTVSRYRMDNTVSRRKGANEYETWAIGQKGNDIIKNCIPIELIGIRRW